MAIHPASARPPDSAWLGVRTGDNGRAGPITDEPTQPGEPGEPDELAQLLDWTAVAAAGLTLALWSYPTGSVIAALALAVLTP